MLKAKKDHPTSKEAQLFAALGDNTRLQLINRLGGGERNSISGLSAGMKLSRQGVTKHLRVLENAGVVKSTRVGRELHFSLQPEALTPLQEYLDLVSTQWDDAIERLRSLVEEK
ncbi:MAG: transcriptional regulator [SAR86 cluster bacterium]|uniref:Transcriptional regulator n=1 Tax=SAR86 cluster bacterium TaxID=2030880 RepID=A0A2A4WX67_9GAMM|nr:MAG: transcriptional regulator [SAR86 cluster bacterium]